MNGNLSTVPFPDVLQLLRNGGQHGVLFLRRGEETVRLVLRAGAIVFAGTDHPDRRWDVYCRRRLAPRLAVARARRLATLDPATVEGRQVAARLLSVPASAFDEVLRRWSEAAICEVFLWAGGLFEFEETAGAEDAGDAADAAPFDILSLVMEGLKRADECRHLRSVWPDDRRRVRIAPGWLAVRESGEGVLVSDAAVAAEDLSLLKLIDDHRSLREIVAAGGGFENDVYPGLARLLTAGGIVAGDLNSRLPARAADAPAPVGARPAAGRRWAWRVAAAVLLGVGVVFLVRRVSAGDRAAPVPVTVVSAVGHGAPDAASLEAPAKIDLNRATVAELMTLPRIGPKLAERIVAHRERHGPFAAVEDIRQVSGVGERTFADLVERIEVSSPTSVWRVTTAP